MGQIRFTFPLDSKLQRAGTMSHHHIPSTQESEGTGMECVQASGSSSAQRSRETSSQVPPSFDEYPLNPVSEAPVPRSASAGRWEVVIAQRGREHIDRG